MRITLSVNCSRAKVGAIRGIMKKIFLPFSFLLLSGCATFAPVPPRQVALTTTFDASEVSWFSEKGIGAINGQAFFQTRGGQPRTCAGLEISLQPKSDYGRERLIALYGSAEAGFSTMASANVQFTPDSADYKQARKTSICDAQGNFSFTGLPAGEYFLTTAIMWTVPGQEFMPPQGGLLMQSVKLTDGESARVIMTR